MGAYEVSYKITVFYFVMPCGLVRVTSVPVKSATVIYGQTSTLKMKP
jgi:hypothetical protein